MLKTQIRESEINLMKLMQSKPLWPLKDLVDWQLSVNESLSRNATGIRMGRTLKKLVCLGFCKEVEAGNVRRVELTGKATGLLEAYENASEYLAAFTKGDLHVFLVAYKALGDADDFCVSDVVDYYGDGDRYRQLVGRALASLVAYGLAIRRKENSRSIWYRFTPDALPAYWLLSSEHLQPYLQPLAPLSVRIVHLLIQSSAPMSAREIANELGESSGDVDAEMARTKSCLRQGMADVVTVDGGTRFVASRRAREGDSLLRKEFARHGLSDPYA